MQYIGDDLFALAMAILLATIFVPIILYVLLFIKGGKIVKNPIGFGIVQAYSVLCSIFMFCFRGSKLNLAGAILGFLMILLAVGTAFIKKYDFLMARIVNAILIVLSTIAFWYLEWHVVMLFIVIGIIGILVFLLYLQKKNNVINYRRKNK